MATMHVAIARGENVATMHVATMHVATMHVATMHVANASGDNGTCDNYVLTFGGDAFVRCRLSLGQSIGQSLCLGRIGS
jgi:hypothetical protein